MKAKKSLGQHWLEDPASLQAICDAAELSKEDAVLEVGPGHGSLTHRLVQAAGRVIAVELDSELAASLKTQLPAPNLQVVSGDILQFDLSTMPPGYKVVANIPYYLTGNLVRTLCEAPHPPQRMVLLVQKEVAERICAGPGAMSMLAVSVQYYCEARLGIEVPARLFQPPPKVDSQVVILDYRPEPLFKGVDSKTFFRLVKAGFSSKRKTLLNSLSGGLGLPKEQVKLTLEACGIAAQSRPQELSLADWERLYRATTDR